MYGSTFFVLCLCALFNAGFALKCYTCDSQTLDGCKKGSAQLKESTCGLGHQDYAQFCLLKMVYDNQLKKDNVLSGCETVMKTTTIDKNIQQCQSDSRYQVKDCIVCDSDLCNFTNSASMTKSLFVVLLLPFLYFILN